MKARELPSMRLKNVQTNNIFKLTDRELIGQCLKQTFNSQVPCDQYVDGERRDGYIIRAIPRFKILSCDKALRDLIPKEEATRELRERLLGKEEVNKQPEGLVELKKFCYEKGIHHSASISYEKLLEKVEAWKKLMAADKAEDTPPVSLKKELGIKQETKTPSNKNTPTGQTQKK